MTLYRVVRERRMMADRPLILSNASRTAARRWMENNGMATKDGKLWRSRDGERHGILQQRGRLWSALIATRAEIEAHKIG